MSSTNRLAKTGANLAHPWWITGYCLVLLLFFFGSIAPTTALANNNGATTTPKPLFQPVVVSDGDSPPPQPQDNQPNVVQPQADKVVSTCDEASLVAALTGGGNITFSCSGIITLTTSSSSGIVINTTTSLDGAGQNVTINRNNNGRIFDLSGATTVFTLSNLTLTGANTNSSGGGAAVRNSIAGAKVVISNTTFISNTSAGNFGGVIRSSGGTTSLVSIYNSTFIGNTNNNSYGIVGTASSGQMIISNSTFSNNTATEGGAIMVGGGGTITVTNSSFNQNISTDGAGALFTDVGGTLTVTNSSFTGNSATNVGGVGLNYGKSTITQSTLYSNTAGYGGALYNNANTAQLMIANSTVVSNTATGANGGTIFQDTNGGTISSINNTFYGNKTTVGAGGLLNVRAGTASFTNTISANQVSASGLNCTTGGSAAITDGGNNISYDSDNSCNWFRADPLLGALQNNGGSTQTMALLPGSPALNGANATVCANSPVSGVDQRGISRPQAGGCDVGAYELVITSATILPYAGSSQSTPVNTALAIPLQVLVLDNTGNPQAGVNVTFTAPPTGASGIFAGGSLTFNGTTDVSGVVTASAFTTNLTTGSYVVTATASGISTPTQLVLRNIAGPPATVTPVNGNGQTSVVGYAFPNKLTARVLDVGNNPVSNQAVTFTAPGSGASGVFTNNNTIYTGNTDVNGLITTTTFTANTTVGSYAITATAASASIASFAMTNATPATIQFANANYTVSEGVGSAVVTLTRSGTSAGTIVANVKLADLTTASADYSPLYSSSQLDTTFNPGTGTNTNETYQAIVLSDGKILLAGAQSTYNGQAVRGVARLNSDGSLDTTFLSTGAGTNETVHGMVVQPDGKIIIVGGSFTTYNGVSRVRVARLNSDGSLDTSFMNSSTGANDGVFRVALQPDGKVLIGGNFTTFNGVARSKLARLNSDGSVDTTFAVNGSGPNSTVWAIAVQADGKILIGGNFTTYAGQPANHIARLNSDGTLDTTFTSSTVGANNIVWYILPQSNGKAIVAGEFTSYNGTTVGDIARLNADGSLDATFLSGGSGANGSIRAMAVQNDGKVLFGGSFSTFNGINVNRIGRLTADGNFDPTILSATSNGGPNNLVWTLAAQPDNAFLVGGDLTTYDGVSRNHIARAGGFQVYWADGDGSPKTISLPVVDDSLVETDEQLTFTLDTILTTGTVGNPVSTTVTIVDNEGSSLSVLSGNNQSTPINSPFGQPLIANLKNANNQPLSGQAVVFTAPASGASGTFAGSASNVYTGTTDANGIVTTTVFTANSVASSYNVVATSSGILAPASFTLTNTRASTSITVTSSPNPSTVGQAVTFTASVTPVTATGTVTFTIGSTSVTSNLAGGVATYTTSTLAVGSYPVTATYGGDTSYTGSQVSGYTHVVTNACNPLVVTAITDNGAGNVCGTFSHALVMANGNVTITFALLQGNTITFTGSLTPTLKPGVQINGGGPNLIVLNGNGVAGDGLRLGGNNILRYLVIRRFAGRELVTMGNGPGNKLYFSKVEA